MPGIRGNPRTRSLILGLAWGLFAINLLLPWVLNPSPSLKGWLGFCTTAANVLAFFAAWNLARSQESPRLAWWCFTALLGFLLAIKGLFWLAPSLKAALPRLPWGQPHHLLTHSLEIGAFLAWGTAREVSARRSWLLLEDLLFAAGGFLLVWTLGFREFVETSHAQGLVLALLVANFLFTILNIGLWATLFMRPPRGDQRRLAWVGLGFTWSLGRIAVFSLALSHGWDRLAFEAEALDAFTWLCWTQAFWTPRDVAATGRELEGSRVRALFPYLPAVLSLGLVIILLFTAPTRLDAQTVALLLPVIILLIWRQGLVMHETQSWARTLESQVAQRTQSLVEAQAVLLRTERMNTVATLGAGLAHDLNNLIGVSKNYAELVEQDLAAQQTPDLQDVKRIKESATRAGELTAQLMAFGHQQGVEARVFDLRAHLISRQSLLRMVARDPVTLHLEPGGDRLPVFMDPSQVDQVLVNLLSNARDAMPAGGHIWIRCALKASSVTLEVQDEGTGMPESVRRRIFEPFFTTKASGRGTGLGLASVKAMVDKASGTLTVESQEGCGTTFRIQLPLSSGV